MASLRSSSRLNPNLTGFAGQGKEPRKTITRSFAVHYVILNGFFFEVFMKKKEQLDMLSFLAVFTFLYVKMRFPFEQCKDIAIRSIYEKK